MGERRRSTRRRLALALDLLADNRFDALLDGETPFERAPDVLPALAAPGGDAWLAVPGFC